MHAVDGVSLHVDEGETLGIVGESGCGKTMTALSIMRLLPNGGRIAGGRIKLDGREITELADEDMRKIRGDDIGMIFQDPLSSLNPTHDRRQADRRGGAAAPGRHQAGGLRAGGRGARPGRHAAGAGAGRRVPAPVLRRHAAARDDRDGAGLRAEAADRRRADDRAGRDDPEADPRAHRRPAAAARDGGHPGHPRPRRDRRARGPGRRDVRGQDRGDHRARRRCTPTRATPTPRRCSTRCRRSQRRPGSGCTRFPARRRTWSTRRRAAGSRRAAGTRPTSAAPRTRCWPGETTAHSLRLLLPGRRAGEGRWRRSPPSVEPIPEAADRPAFERGRPATCVLRAQEPGQGLPGDQRGGAAAPGRLGERGRRRVVRHPQGRDARPRRRVRLRQDHDRPACSSAWTSRRAARSASAARTWPGRSGREYRRERRDIQYMFQDSYASLDPRMRAGSILREPLDRAGHRVAPRAARQGRARCSARSGCPRRGPSATRTSSPAGSGSGSASPAR